MIKVSMFIQNANTMKWSLFLMLHCRRDEKNIFSSQFKENDLWWKGKILRDVRQGVLIIRKKKTCPFAFLSVFFWLITCMSDIFLLLLAPSIHYSAIFVPFGCFFLSGGLTLYDLPFTFNYFYSLPRKINYSHHCWLVEDQGKLICQLNICDMNSACFHCVSSLNYWDDDGNKGKSMHAWMHLQNDEKRGREREEAMQNILWFAVLLTSFCNDCHREKGIQTDFRVRRC